MGIPRRIARLHLVRCTAAVVALLIRLRHSDLFSKGRRDFGNENEPDSATVRSGRNVRKGIAHDRKGRGRRASVLECGEAPFPLPTIFRGTRFAVQRALLRKLADAQQGNVWSPGFSRQARGEPRRTGPAKAGTPYPAPARNRPIFIMRGGRQPMLVPRLLPGNEGVLEAPASQPLATTGRFWFRGLHYPAFLPMAPALL